MKEEIRQQYKTLRQKMPLIEVKRQSQQITQRLLASSLWQAHKTIMLYLSFGHEVGTDELFQRGWQEGKTLLIPICQAGTTTMFASQINSLDQLIHNQYGIRELPPALVRPMPAEQIELCLIPGIAFDYQGNRLGFGAGYYDRFLAQLAPHTPKVALAFSRQLSIVPLPTDQYDISVDYICTE